MKKRAVAAIVVNKHNEILLVKKNENSDGLLKGKWHIPGETIEPHESDISGLLRGIWEEAGIEIEVWGYLAYGITPNCTLVVWYECATLLPRPILRPGSDISDAKWVAKSEIKNFCDSVVISLWPEEIKDYFEVIKAV